MPGNDNGRPMPGRVVEHADGTQSITVGPFSLHADGRAELDVTFDRELRPPLSALVPDPDKRRELGETAGKLFSSVSDRMDDLATLAGLDPGSDFRGSDLSGIELCGSPERPLDLRGWDFGGCTLDGCRFEHVVADDTTQLQGASLEDLSGSDADTIRDIASRQAPLTP